MMFDEFVQRIKLDDPQEIFASTVTEHFKMLYAVAESVGIMNIHNKNIKIINFIQTLFPAKKLCSRVLCKT